MDRYGLVGEMHRSSDGVLDESPALHPVDGVVRGGSGGC